MRRLTRPEIARAGFTLVELMVAMALIILIMAILAGAFQVGLDTMSQLKSVAGLSEQLRSAESVLRRDLSANHLEDEWARPVRVSDKKVQDGPWTGAGQKRGFLRVRQVSPIRQETSSGPYQPVVPWPPASSPNDHRFAYEGSDPDGVSSFRATDQVLHLTSRLSGVNADEVYIGLAPATLAASSMNRHDLKVGNQFVSQWAEIAYFLLPSGLATTGDESAGGRTLTLYTLYRRQRALTPGRFSFNPSLDQNQYPAISVPPGDPTRTNDPLSITSFTDRLNSNALASVAGTSPEYGSDILLSNVVSFQIRLQFDGQPGFSDEWLTGVAGQSARTDPPGGTTAVPRVYDTADAPTDYTAVGGKPRIRAMQIKLRIYDTRNKMTRQVSIIKDM